MQSSGSPRLSNSANSKANELRNNSNANQLCNSETNDFNVTILDNKILLVRLATELDRAVTELRWAIDQLRRDPAEFMRVVSSKAVCAIRRQLTLTNLVGYI